MGQNHLFNIYEILKSMCVFEGYDVKSAERVGFLNGIPHLRTEVQKN